MSSNSRGFRNALLSASALAGAAALLATPAAAQDARRVEFNMPAQPLTVALKAYGATADQQLIFSERLVEGRQAPPLKGAYTPDQALAMLLADTGLIADRTPGGVVTIRSAAQAPQGGSAAGGGATLEALIVTAQKREEDIQDVPIAISAFSQEDLTRSQIAGGPDLMTQVPNMTFTKTNFSSYSIQLRGIGTQAISATTDPAVAVAFNNTPFIRNHFFEQEFYDLQRVEVLRGPQGTLYGRNATAGVVNVISAKPKFFYEARAAADIANYNTTRIEGMINVPLVEDMAALRIAGAWTKRDGYAFNEITGSPIDGRDLWSTRVSLRVSPNDRVDANLIWEHFEEDDDRLRSGKQLCDTDEVISLAGFTFINGALSQDAGAFDDSYAGADARFSQGCEPSSLYAPESFQTPNGKALPYYVPLGAIFLPIGLDDPYVSRTQSRDLRVVESAVDPHYVAKSDLAEIQLSIDLTDSLTLTSETAWMSDFIFSTQDYNRFNTARGAWDVTEGAHPDYLASGILYINEDGYPEFDDPQIGKSDRLVAVDLSTASYQQFSQELRVASNYDGPFNFSLGANFLRLDGEDKYYVFINSLSLYAARGSTPPYSIPWDSRVTDHYDCLRAGGIRPDVNLIYPVSEACQYIDPNPIENLSDRGHNYFLSRNPYKLISYAVFGEAYYNATDNLKVTAGLRWTVDKKEAPRIPSWILAGDTLGYPVAEVVEQEWREPTGRLTVDWKPDLAFTDETLLYFSYAHGYKAGGANPPAAGNVVYAVDPDARRALIQASATKPKTFDPEFVDAFEVGAKNTLADGKVTLNLAAFYYNYKDYQISYITDRSAVNLNFDAKIWGLELEGDWRPVENLRFGLKLGYEDTRVGDGEKAIDVMDRNAGHHEGSDDPWVVVKPFPTFSNNCVLPLSIFNTTLGIRTPGNVRGGGLGPCELAYLRGLDPVTKLPYVEDPVVVGDIGTGEPVSGTQPLDIRPGYPGFNPFDESQGHNFGAGFYKDLGGNELPNAPHYTATITTDYTVPLAGDWLMTLHSDLYYQSEAWTRIFNVESYDKLKAYTNVNLAAIFTNEPGGWKVMAYVKNVFDRDSITGAFLNSDDSGLTTNVFLTEPRLYGLRVTKEWSGGPLLGTFGSRHDGPYPLTVELGGMVQRTDAPSETMKPSFTNDFVAALRNFNDGQNRDLDWGDSRSVKLTWRPDEIWKISATVRFGRTNNDTGLLRVEDDRLGAVCGISPAFAPFDTYYCDPESPLYRAGFVHHPLEWSDAEVRGREDHTIVDFTVGRDFGLGAAADRSAVSAGLRYAEFGSLANVDSRGQSYVYDVVGWASPFTRKPSFGEIREAEFNADREFEGVGPMLSWEAAKRLFGNDEVGHVDLDWSISGAVLFGKQNTNVSGSETEFDWLATAGYGTALGKYQEPHVPVPDTVQTAPLDIAPRSKSVTVPVAGLSLGLTYEVDRLKVSSGYHWERYFDVIDGGFDEAQKVDRTFDGPYFRISVGFGGG